MCRHNLKFCFNLLALGKRSTLHMGNESTSTPSKSEKASTPPPKVTILLLLLKFNTLLRWPLFE